MNRIIFVLLLFLIVTGTAASAQDAQTSHSRVRQQRQNGLQYPAMTQIGEGTISPSARGEINQGQSQLPSTLGLPSTALGPHVLPGDGSRSDLPGTRTINAGLPAAPIGPHMLAGDKYRSDLHPEVFKSKEKFWHPEVRPNVSPQRLNDQLGQSQGGQTIQIVPTASYERAMPIIRF